jgi:hypothetical protein
MGGISYGYPARLLGTFRLLHQPAVSAGVCLAKTPAAAEFHLRNNATRLLCMLFISKELLVLARHSQSERLVEWKPRLP